MDRVSQRKYWKISKRTNLLRLNKDLSKSKLFIKSQLIGINKSKKNAKKNLFFFFLKKRSARGFTRREVYFF